MGKYLPTILWRSNKHGYPCFTLRTNDKSSVGIAVYGKDAERSGGVGWEILMNRRMARLLAKRLNEFLDETK